MGCIVVARIIPLHSKVIDIDVRQGISHHINSVGLFLMLLGFLAHNSFEGNNIVNGVGADLECWCRT